jgi:FKBP-type peptidyl-prolyl cis-trans isomerase SlyD
MSDEQEAEAAEPEADEPETGADDQAEAADETESGLQDGDFVRLEYTLRTADDGRVVDTTGEDLAEEEGLETEGREFEPQTIVLGANQMFESVEDALVGGEVGDEGEVTVPMEEAFGEFDEEQVRTVATNSIPEDSRYPGAQVTIDGDQGVVEAVYGGRSRVDFNHPLAGEDLEYEYEIVGVVEDRVEQAQGMLNTYFDVDLEMHIETDEVEESVAPEAQRQEGGEAADEETVVEPDEDEDDEDAEPETETEVVEKETLYIESNPQLQFNQQWMFSKQQIAQDLIDRVGVDRVIIQDVIEGQPAGMPGMMGGMGGGGDLGDVEEALEDADVDADEIADELELDEGGEADAEDAEAAQDADAGEEAEATEE